MPSFWPWQQKLHMRSLALRLTVTSALVLIIALATAYLFLINSYRSSVTANLQDRLDGYILTLARVMTTQEDVGPKDITLQEEAFSRVYSGWYWQICEPSPDITDFQCSTSPSLWGSTLERLSNPPELETETHRGTVQGPDGKLVMLAQRAIITANNRKLQLMVAANEQFVDKDVARFNIYLFWTLTGLFLVVTMAVFVQVKVGLLPLKALQHALNDVRNGKSRKLEGWYASEVQPLAQELNAVIGSNQAIVERAQKHTGNLAHALKTPLSVIINEAQYHDFEGKDKIIEQTQIMQKQISHHLSRSQAAARSEIIVQNTGLRDIIFRMCRAMERIHGGKGLVIRNQVIEEYVVRSQKQDIEEMLGNLLDNACKWARSTIQIAVRPTMQGEREMVEIIVEDDGPGIDQKDLSQLGIRGKRLDQSKPGTGLGLSIVTEFAELYKGHLEFSRSSQLNGLKVVVSLPLSKETASI